MAEFCGNTGYISDMDVRIFLRDLDPAANLLLDDFEFSPEEIRSAQTLAVDYWNEQPPDLVGARFHAYNFPHRYNLLMATCANLLFMAANLFRRNRLPHSIPGGGIDDQNKFNEYEAAGGRLWGQYKEWVSLKKRAMNTERGWGMV